MAKYRSRVALNAASFPLSTVLAGRTVMQSQLDANVRTPKSFYGGDESAELSIPQLIYAENVMPTAEGLMSVGFQQQIMPLAGAIDFDQAITLRDADENNFLYVPARGKNYIWNAGTGAWNSVNPFAGWTGKLVTRAYVNGRTFICFENRGIYEYDATANTFLPQPITGLTATDVRGIGSSSNYLIAFTDLEVHWSSLIDPLDFVPSLSTGAGFSIPQDVKARITAVLGISGGFIVYTAKNAIAAVYTNNTRAPFTFKEIANAGGIQTYEQVTSEQTSGAQYAWTTGGLQKITVQSAEPVSGEVNDFIAGKMWDEFDPVTKMLVTGYSAATEFPVKLSYISSRYMVLSYSTSSDNTLYQWALILDTVLKRWGKLKIQHTDCFSYPYPNVKAQVRYQDLAHTTYADLTSTTYADFDTNGVISDPPSKLTIAFMSPAGEVTLARMDYDKEAADDAVIILGKFQLRRSNIMTFQQLDLEGVYVDTTPFPAPAAPTPKPMTVSLSTSRRGGVTDLVQEMRLFETREKWSKYQRRLSGMNLNIIVEGTFALSTGIIEVTEGGSR